MILFASMADGDPRRQEVSVDDSLLIGVAEGNREAFTALYRITGAAVYAYALSILRNPTEAEDAMQDTFLKIRCAAALYQPRGRAMAWILTITRNVSLMKLRQKKHLSLYAPEDAPAAPDWSPVSDLDDRLVLQSAMKVLSAEEGQIVILHAVTGWKHREIAAQLQLPLSTVLSKYHRGLRKLRAELEGKL